MISRRKANSKLIADVVKEEVDNVRELIKEQLAKKMDFYESMASNEKLASSGFGSISKFDPGNYYNSFLQTWQDIADEIMTALSTETVRRVRSMLSDVKSRFKSMTSGEIKPILDKLYELVAFTGIKAKTNRASVAFDTDLFSFKNTKGEDKKGKELRSLIQQLLFKFVHDNAIAYLGRDMYPSSYEEAKQFNGFDAFADKVAEQYKISAIQRMQSVHQAEANAQQQRADEMAATAKKLQDEENLQQQLNAQIGSQAVRKHRDAITYAIGGAYEAKRALVGFVLQRHPEYEAKYTIEQLWQHILNRRLFDTIYNKFEWVAEHNGVSIAEAADMYKPYFDRLLAKEQAGTLIANALSPGKVPGVPRKPPAASPAGNGAPPALSPGSAGPVGGPGGASAPAPAPPAIPSAGVGPKPGRKTNLVAILTPAGNTPDEILEGFGTYTTKQKREWIIQHYPNYSPKRFLLEMGSYASTMPVDELDRAIDTMIRTNKYTP